MSGNQQHEPIHNAHPSSGAERAPDAACRHHWLIASPDGPVSDGICRRCGLTREFTNALAFDPAPSWDDLAEFPWELRGPLLW